MYENPKITGSAVGDFIRYVYFRNNAVEYCPDITISVSTVIPGDYKVSQ